MYEDGLNFFIPNRSADLIKTYGDFWGVKDIFNELNTGIQTKRDDLVIHFEIDKLKSIICDFIDLSIVQLKQKFGEKESSGWNYKNAKNDLMKNEKTISFQKIIYRPFDIRITAYTGISSGFMGRPRHEMMKHFIDKKNIGLVTVRLNLDYPNIISFVSDTIIEKGSLPTSNYSLFPLYIYPKKDSLSNDITTNFTKNFNSFLKENYADKSPEEIFSYIYAVLFSSTYRKKYNDLLKFDFPRIPFNCKKEIFNKLSEIGQTLIDLHLLKTNPISNKATFDIDEPSDIVSKVEYKSGNIYFNETTYFGGVSEEVWNYYFGGYQVLKSWLDYRRKVNYSLKNEDKKHFLNVINLIYDTIDIQKTIDKLTKDWI